MAYGITKYEMPSAEKLRELYHYDPDTGELRRYSKTGKLGRLVPKRGAPRNAQVRIGSRTFQVSRLVWKMITGEEPKCYIDHINGDRYDNRWCNLRQATAGENGANAGKRGGFNNPLKGAYKHRKSGKWLAQIGHNGKDVYIGSFSTPEEAHEAYLKKARELFGEFVNDGKGKGVQ